MPKSEWHNYQCAICDKPYGTRKGLQLIDGIAESEDHDGSTGYYGPIVVCVGECAEQVRESLTMITRDEEWVGA
jgi:hypothetical protein